MFDWFACELPFKALLFSQVWLLSAVIHCNTPALVSVPLKAAFPTELDAVWFTPQGLCSVDGRRVKNTSSSPSMPVCVVATPHMAESPTVISARNEA